MKAARRVVIGRNITLSAGIVYSLSRAAYYATLNPDTASRAQDVITADGRLLGAWAAVWALAAIFCVVDMVNRHTRHGLSLVVGLAFAWGIAYALIWAFTGFREPTLISAAIGWVTPAALVFGFLIKVTALQDMLRDKTPPGGD
jgi:hypothetical protein